LLSFFRLKKINKPERTPQTTANLTQQTQRVNDFVILLPNPSLAPVQQQPIFSLGKRFCSYYTRYLYLFELSAF
jgi:hypothetical protein